MTVTLFGVWLGWQLSIVRERKALLKEIERCSHHDDGWYLGLESLESQNCAESEHERIGQLIAEAGGFEHVRISRVRRHFGDETCLSLTLPRSLDSRWVERVEIAFPEARLEIAGGNETRDALYESPATRHTNKGTVFKTGLIEKSPEGQGQQ